MTNEEARFRAAGLILAAARLVEGLVDEEAPSSGVGCLTQNEADGLGRLAERLANFSRQLER